jgi:hypothetical protein
VSTVRCKLAFYYYIFRGVLYIFLIYIYIRFFDTQINTCVIHNIAYRGKIKFIFYLLQSSFPALHLCHQASSPPFHWPGSFFLCLPRRGLVCPIGFLSQWVEPSPPPVAGAAATVFFDRVVGRHCFLRRGRRVPPFSSSRASGAATAVFLLIVWIGRHHLRVIWIDGRRFSSGWNRVVEFSSGSNRRIESMEASSVARSDYYP